jgi:hypothetical protein
MDAGPPRTAKGPETTAIGGDRVELTDRDVDALVWQFLNSAYVGDEYACWPLDRRLDGFLRRRGLGRLADDGDSFNIVLHRVMFGISVLPRQGGESSAGAQRSHELADTGPAGGPSANGGVVSPRASRRPHDPRPVTQRRTRSGRGGNGC